ncbi:hypothetical protein [Pseudomonas sp. S2_C03]
MIGVLPKSEINELLAMAQADGLTLTDLARICQAFNIAPKQVLNELSVAVAGGYLDGSLAYEFCDDVMNGIINAVVEVSMTEDIPQPAFLLYQAFDQGEWLRSDDPLGTDTGENYTKPLVVKIMQTLKG